MTPFLRSILHLPAKGRLEAIRTNLSTLSDGDLEDIQNYIEYHAPVKWRRPVNGRAVATWIACTLLGMLSVLHVRIHGVSPPYIPALAVFILGACTVLIGVHFLYEELGRWFQDALHNHRTRALRADYAHTLKLVDERRVAMRNDVSRELLKAHLEQRLKELS